MSLIGLDRLYQGKSNWKSNYNFHTSNYQKFQLDCRIPPHEFWKHVLSWLRKNDIDVGGLKEADLIFGKFDIQDDFILINHILLLGKYYIYSQKCQNAKPSLKGFIAKMKRIYSIELHIARKGDKLSFHLKKWNKLISVVANGSI